MGKRPRLPVIVASIVFCIAPGLAGRAEAQTLLVPGSIACGEPLAIWAESLFPLEEAEARLIGPTGLLAARAKGFYLPSAEGIFLYGFLLPVPLKTAPGK
ncbi:MAG TPA: hypothetical protein VIO60_03570, partial [Rectinemataceae bacterium]